ncbi:MAG: hypothetical protein AAGA56_03340, partial [Myxococcota bacterium]
RLKRSRHFSSMLSFMAADNAADATRRQERVRPNGYGFEQDREGLFIALMTTAGVGAAVGIGLTVYGFSSWSPKTSIRLGPGSMVLHHVF